MAFFAAAYLSCPVIFTQLYAFVAPGLYKHEKNAFAPYLFATPIFFAIGALLVYFVVMPNLLHFFIGMQQSKEPGRARDRAAAARQRVPLARHDADLRLRRDVPAAGDPHPARADRHRRHRAFLRAKRRYAVVLVFVASAVLTPPDAFSMLALAVPAYALYEGAIVSVGVMERRRAREQAKRDAEAA